MDETNLYAFDYEKKLVGTRWDRRKGEGKKKDPNIDSSGQIMCQHMDKILFVIRSNGVYQQITYKNRISSVISVDTCSTVLLFYSVYWDHCGHSLPQLYYSLVLNICRYKWIGSINLHSEMSRIQHTHDIPAIFGW